LNFRLSTSWAIIPVLSLANWCLEQIKDCH
jgi:hypothetical protein